MERLRAVGLSSWDRKAGMELTREFQMNMNGISYLRCSPDRQRENADLRPTYCLCSVKSVINLNTPSVITHCLQILEIISPDVGFNSKRNRSEGAMRGFQVLLILSRFGFNMCM